MMSVLLLASLVTVSIIMKLSYHSLVRVDNGHWMMFHVCLYATLFLQHQQMALFIVTKRCVLSLCMFIHQSAFVC